ncbi:hypothetical protein OUZ56_006550 [Daphnia magna]|uniref:Uncharacterized protein n=1 Tax=Daphnia magna TaxID=35525 RepID=A0ABQ9YVZ4_9CRUS|nr:hypothetical protein OUZ56_006550 [Daphnia magna]
MDCFPLKLRALVVVQTLDRCAYPYQKMADKFEFLYFAVVFSILRLSHGLPVSSDVDTTAAIELAEAMDATADPCQDFFQYACGGWIKKNSIPTSKSGWSQFDILNQKLTQDLTDILKEKNSLADPLPVRLARQMYSDCMDNDTTESLGLTPLTNYLDGFGGWPMTLDHWKDSSFNWTKTTASALTTFNLPIIISIFNELDTDNTNASLIYIDQDSLYLPRSVLVNMTGNPTISTAYKKIIVQSAKAIRDWQRSNVTDVEIESQVDAVLKFESQLATITVSDGDRRNSSRMYNPMTLMELQNWTDSLSINNSPNKINWLDYLNAIYSSADIAIPKTERLVIVELDYLKQLVQLLNKTPPRVLANYIHWRIVDALAMFTNQRMADLQFEFAKVSEGISKPISRSHQCVNVVNELMGMALGSVYVQRVFDDQSVEEIKEMIVILKKSFKSLLSEASWMDSTTKTIAKEKVDAMIELVAYPTWLKNKTALENYYDGIITTSTGSNFYNIQQVHSFLNRNNLANLREKTDRTEWNEKPTIVNAFYSGTTNSITFPAAILQPPFFGKGRSAAINYGAMGSMIGHEITHGFDDEGRQSDKYGNTAQWWSQKTLELYQERATCFINEYSNFTVLNGSKLNGVNTQGENIADNGGVREAFRAYRYYVAANGRAETTKFENLTPEQVFFLAYANSLCGTNTPQMLRTLIEKDPHSPYRYRVIGTLSNNEDFVRAFECGPDTPMNRLNKCVLW